jgi:hypothetical protein
MARSAPTLALAVVLSACGGGADGADAGAGTGTDAGPRGDAGGSDTARVELGTGRTSFVEIPESGAELELIAGPQGGWHIDVTARLYDLAIDGMLLTYEITRDGTVISMPRQFMLREAIVVREGDHWLRAGDFVPFEITQPSDVAGDTVTVRVIAEATDGARAEDERSVTIVDRE